jgi:hypothetical protein
MMANGATTSVLESSSLEYIWLGFKATDSTVAAFATATSSEAVEVQYSTVSVGVQSEGIKLVSRLGGAVDINWGGIKALWAVDALVMYTMFWVSGIPGPIRELDSFAKLVPEFSAGLEGRKITVPGSNTSSGLSVTYVCSANSCSPVKVVYENACKLLEPSQLVFISFVSGSLEMIGSATWST